MAFFDFLKKDCEGFPITSSSKGPKVIEVQNFMIAKGQPIQADGAWGNNSKRAAQNVFGTDTVSCDQYRKLAGKGITPDKINNAVGYLEAGISIVDMIKGGRNNKPLPPPPPPPPPNNTPIYLAVAGGVIVVIILIVLLLKK